MCATLCSIRCLAHQSQVAVQSAYSQTCTVHWSYQPSACSQCIRRPAGGRLANVLNRSDAVPSVRRCAWPPLCWSGPSCDQLNWPTCCASAGFVAGVHLQHGNDPPERLLAAYVIYTGPVFFMVRLMRCSSVANRPWSTHRRNCWTGQQTRISGMCRPKSFLGCMTRRSRCACSLACQSVRSRHSFQDSSDAFHRLHHAPSCVHGKA